MTFTTEEENMICIFHAINRRTVMDNIRAAMPDFDEPEMQGIAENALHKLDTMSDAGFFEYEFTPAY